MKRQRLSTEEDILLVEGEREREKFLDRMAIEEMKNDPSKPKMRRRQTSRLLDNIPGDVGAQLFDNLRDPLINNNNQKADNICRIIGPGFKPLGVGTNRAAFLKDGYVYKIALDTYGLEDNMSEFKRSKEYPEYLARAYEICYENTVLVSEYVNLLMQEEWETAKSKMEYILKKLSQDYVMRDLGLTQKNFCNWGWRTKDKSLVILDYAYLYPIKGNEHALICNCGSRIKVDDTFTIYKCTNPNCGLKYTPMEILNKMAVDRVAMENLQVYAEAGVDVSFDEASNSITSYTTLEKTYSKPSDTLIDGDINSTSLKDAMKKFEPDEDFVSLNDDYEDDEDAIIPGLGSTKGLFEATMDRINDILNEEE